MSDGLGDRQAGPGSQGWGAPELSCTDDADCGTGEGCYDQICQPRQCEGLSTTSRPPLGAVHPLVTDLEIAVATSSSVHVLSPGPSLSQLEDTQMLVGIAGDAVGLVGGRPDASGTPALGVVDGAHLSWYGLDGGLVSRTLPVSPTAAAAGDVDGDGIDDVAVVSAGGTLAACTSSAAECAVIADLGVESSAVGIGWLGDEPSMVVAVSEPDSGLMVVDGAGERRLLPVDDEVDRLALADLDADGIDEIVTIHHGALLSSDHLRVYRVADGDLESVATVDVGDARDLAVGDLDADRRPDIVVLTDAGADVFHVSGDVLSRVGSAAVPDGARHLALYDRDDDSAVVRLVDGPEVVSGNPVPMIAVTFGPYDRDFSRGVPVLSMGSFDGHDEGVSSGVSMDIGVEIGVSAGGLGLLSGGFSAALSRRIKSTTSHDHYYSIGQWLELTAQPERYGDRYGAVLLGLGCYERYRYRVVDPGGAAGIEEGELVEILVPAGGTTSLWSTQRYRELASVRGDLPPIEINTRLGNVASYPRVPLTLDGRPIAAEDQVFAHPPAFQVSDVAEMGWSMSMGDQETSAASTKIALSGKATLGAFDASISLHAGLGFDQEHWITIDHSTLLRGRTPPIPDDPTTPEDEYAARAFTFRPYLYHHHYQTPGGDDAAYFALTYAVGEAR